jgi:hypothetical protein
MLESMMCEVVAKPQSAPYPMRPIMRMGTASVGPRQWQDDTVKTLKLGKGIVKKSDKEKEYGRQHDTLPVLRDNLVRQSNTVSFGYVREVRVVVVKLRENLLLVNEEVKLLLKTKAATEKTLDFLRKDIHVNKKSVDVRKTRPKREKDLDEADKYLECERAELEKQKKVLECHLKATKRQLVVLDQSRKRLARVLDERSQVLDLVCHSRNATKHDHLLRAQLLPETARPATSFSGMPTPKLDNSNINEIIARTANVGDQLRRSLMAVERNDREEMMMNGLYTTRTARPADNDRPSTPPISNLGPYTPEAASSIDESREQIAQSESLRKEVAEAIAEAERQSRRMHAVVNDAITQRLAETITLMEHLNMGEAENRSSFHRNVRHYEKTDWARGNLLGPTRYDDIKVAERLDRPIVKVYQRHPGTNVPDARDIIRGNNNLESSLEQTQKNLALLHLSNMKLREDNRDKKAAADIDASVIRFRKNKADHRWVPAQ